MPANRFGVDLGGALREGGAIREQRNRNAMGDINLSEKRLEIAERPAKQKAERERNAMLTDLRGKSAGGDEEARQQLMALDPENAPKFFEMLNTADDRKLDAIKRATESAGKAAAHILIGKDAAEQTKRYSQFRSELSPEAAKEYPEVYDRSFMEKSLRQAQNVDQILQAKVNTIGQEDVMRVGGLETERAINPTKKNAMSKGSGGSDEITVTDENSMFDKIKFQLGGVFTTDAEGRRIVTVTDPTIRKKGQAIFDEATRLNREDGVPRPQAVTMALNKFGENIPKLPKPTDGLPEFVQNSMNTMDTMSQQQPQQAAQPQQPAQPAQVQQTYPEGTIAKNAEGVTLIVKNGEFVPYNQ